MSTMLKPPQFTEEEEEQLGRAFGTSTLLEKFIVSVAIRVIGLLADASDWLKDQIRTVVAEMFGVADPAQARGAIQSLVNEAVDKAIEPLTERLRRLEEAGRLSDAPAGPQRDPEMVRTEIIPGIVVAVMNDRAFLESLSYEEVQALTINRDYVSSEFVQRIWDHEILRDLWGSEEGMRERRMEAVAKFIDAEMEAMVSAMKKILKRSKAAQEKANIGWAQYLLVHLGVDPADTKAVRTAMGRQPELKAYLK